MGEVKDSVVYLEDGIPEHVQRELEALGHTTRVLKGFERGMFGRGQIIRLHESHGKVVHSAGSDPRGDGAAYPVTGL